MNGPRPAIAPSVLACGVPMVLFAVRRQGAPQSVDRHRLVAAPPAARDDRHQHDQDRRAVDDWALMAGFYAVMRYYWEGNYAFSMDLLELGGAVAAARIRCPICCGSTAAWSNRATAVTSSDAG